MDSTPKSSLTNSTSWTVLRDSMWSWMQSSIAVSPQESRNYETTTNLHPFPRHPAFSSPQTPPPRHSALHYLSKHSEGPQQSILVVYSNPCLFILTAHLSYDRDGTEVAFSQAAILKTKQKKWSNLSYKNTKKTNSKERYKDQTQVCQMVKLSLCLSCTILAWLQDSGLKHVHFDKRMPSWMCPLAQTKPTRINVQYKHSQLPWLEQCCLFNMHQIYLSCRVAHHLYTSRPWLHCYCVHCTSPDD